MKEKIVITLIILSFSHGMGAAYSQSKEETAPDVSTNKTQEKIDQEVQQEIYN